MDGHPQLRLLRSLIMHLSDPACLVSPPGRVLAYNGPFALHYRKRFGKGLKPGADAHELLAQDPPLRAWAGHYWARALAGEPVSSVQDLGQGLMLELHLLPVRDEGGNVLAACQIVRDISFRRRAEVVPDPVESLGLQSPEGGLPVRFSSVISTMPFGLLYHDAQGRLLEANPAAERILGAAASELDTLLSRDQYWRVIREDGVPLPGLLYPAHAALQTGSDVKEVVMGFIHPGLESYRWVQATAVPLYDGGNRPTQVYTILEDITSRKLAETLSGGDERFYESIVSALPQLALVASAEGAMLYCNSQWQQYTGLDLPASQHGGWLTSLHPEDRPALERELDLVQQHSEATSTRCRLRRHLDGVYRWFRLDFRPLRDGEGRVTRWICIGSDIDEQVLAELALERTAASNRAPARVSSEAQPGKDAASALKSPDLQPQPLPAQHVWDEAE